MFLLVPANLDFTEARDSEWQWHQLGHMQACTSLQTDNHASTSPLSFFTGRMPFLPPNQQRQSTEGKDVMTASVKIPVLVPTNSQHSVFQKQCNLTSYKMFNANYRNLNTINTHSTVFAI